MRTFLTLVFLAITLFGAQVELYFWGNKTFSSDRLYKELGLEPPWWVEILHKKWVPKVDEKLLPSLKEELQLFYKEQGFWDAKIRLKRERNKALFLIQEGPPLVIRAISVTSDFPIRIPFKKNERFVAPLFKRMKEQITKRLLKRGYCSFEFNPKAYIHHTSHSVYISIYLRKGKICRIASIKVKGLRTLPKRVVLDHIYLRPGQKLNLDHIEQSYKRLYSLEYFSGVRIDYSKKIKNRVFVDIWLKERKKHHLYKAGIGYETDRGPLLSFGYKDFNFHTYQLTLTLFHSKLEQKSALSLFIPSLPLLKRDFDTVLFGEYALEDFHSFKQKTIQISSKILQESFSYAYTLGIGLQRQDIFDAIFCIPQKRYFYANLFASYLLDKRDSKLFPTKGWYISSKIESSFFGDPNYLKVEAKGGLYLPLNKAIVLFKAHIGQLFSSSNAPPSLFFLAGGAQSNRAYGYHTIYALDSPCQIGGNALNEGSIELRYPLSKSLYGALFWDRTYVTRSRSNLTDHVDALGAGILYPSAIGTLKAYMGIDPFHPSHHALNLYIGAVF